MIRIARVVLVDPVLVAVDAVGAGGVPGLELSGAPASGWAIRDRLRVDHLQDPGQHAGAAQVDRPGILHVADQLLEA